MLGATDSPITTFKSIPSNTGDICFETGATYEIKSEKSVTKAGFSGFEYPLDAMTPVKDVDGKTLCNPMYYKTKQSGKIDVNLSTGEVRSSVITVEEEMTDEDMAYSAVDYIRQNLREKIELVPFETCGTDIDIFTEVAHIGGMETAVANNKSCISSVTEGTRSAAVSSGSHSASEVQGNRCAAIVSGERSAAVARGNNNIAGATTENCIATERGENSVAATVGGGSIADAGGTFSIAATAGDNSLSRVHKGFSVAAGTGNGSGACADERSAAVVTGDDGKAVSLGDNGIAAATGNMSRTVTEQSHSISAVVGNNAIAGTTAPYNICAATGKNSRSVVSANCSIAAAAGIRNEASVCGNQSVSVTIGALSKASAVCGGIAIAAGIENMASAEDSLIAAAFGNKCMAKGGVGTWLFLTEWNFDGDKIVDARAVRVDGKDILADTPYTLIGGQIIPASPGLIKNIVEGLPK